MVDLQPVCSMCGDVGFPDKLFQCSKCRFRFQHSYCSNNYEEFSESNEGYCNWCKSEERSGGRHGDGVESKRSARKDAGITNRSEYSGDKIKQNLREENSDKGKSTSNNPSPRPSGRRYKLLKDVLS